MANVNLIKSFRKKAKQTALNRRDPRFIKTMALLKAKGLLDTTLPILPLPSVRIDIKDALWAAKYVEPRILEVLPAAILHFNKNFIGLEHVPEELKIILQKIKANEVDGPDIDGIEYKKMKFWANIKLSDKRTKPSQEKKRTKVFRLKLETIAKLENLVKSRVFKDQTQAIDEIIKKFTA
jgi:hypothetical protein